MPADQRRDARWNSSSGRPPGETAQAARTHWLAARCVSAIARVICSNFLGGSRRSSLIARILVGTACWADPSLITTKRFYPKDASKLEPMLQHYATRFPMAEVDSSYYALPSSVNAQKWAEHTPDDFTFGENQGQSALLKTSALKRYAQKTLSRSRSRLGFGTAVASRWN